MRPRTGHLIQRGVTPIVGGLMVAAMGVAPATAAAATACGNGPGVTVVVDHQELGAGVEQVCDVDGADKSAATLLTDSGFPLTYVQTLPGFVCRVRGLPTLDQDACVRTPPADAFWSVWWSDGVNGRWVYSALGVEALEVPDGGYVGLSWQQGPTEAPPRLDPVASAVPTSPRAGDAPPAAGPLQETPPVAVGGNLPAWVPPGLIGLLFSGAAAATLLRRRGAAGP